MKKFSLMLVLLAMTALLMTSCEEDNDDDNPPVDNSTVYYPMEVGKFRVYETVRSETTIERSENMETSQVSGYTATRIDNSSGPDADNLTLDYSAYYRVEGSKVYVQGSYFNQIVAGFGLTDLFDADWYLIIDPNLSSTQEIFSRDLDGLTIPVPNFGDVELKSVSLSLINGGKVNIDAPAYSGETQHMRFEIQLVANALAQDLPVAAIIDNYYAENIGLVNSVVGDFIATVPVTNQELKLLDGSFSELIEYGPMETE